MKRIYAIIIIFVAVGLAAVAASYAYVQWHTTVLEQRDTMILKAVEIRDSPKTTVRVSGGSGNIALSVESITTENEGSSLVVLVHLFLARQGTTGSFEYDVPVPDSVNEIRFGTNKALIWKRRIGLPN